jgi:hypothetical protein
MFKKQQKDKNKDKAKKDLKGILAACKSRICRFNLNTWYFSVFFFGAIFLVSIWVWWLGFYDPKPSPEVVAKFESSKENFEGMKSKTETAIELLKNRQEKVRNAPDFSEQRDLFVDRRELEFIEAERANREAQNQGGLPQQPVENAEALQ